MTRFTIRHVQWLTRDVAGDRMACGTRQARSGQFEGNSTVKMLADGKEAVLSYLESQLAGMPGFPGRYVLAEDDAGRLIICVAGCMFIGEGETVLDGVRLAVRKGISSISNWPTTQK